MREFKVAQVFFNRAVKRNSQHSKLKQFTVCLHVLICIYPVKCVFNLYRSHCAICLCINFLKAKQKPIFKKDIQIQIKEMNTCIR